MSYDIYLKHVLTRAVLQLEKPHQHRGGTYRIGGSTEAWLNITYNYAPHFRRVFGEQGIRAIYGMRARDSVDILLGAAAQLNDDENAQDYWQPTEGNARAALLQLVALAELLPDGVWDGD